LINLAAESLPDPGVEVSGSSNNNKKNGWWFQTCFIFHNM
jgi:hypothetical protein